MHKYIGNIKIKIPFHIIIEKVLALFVFLVRRLVVAEEFALDVFLDIWLLGILFIEKLIKTNL